MNKQTNPPENASPKPRIFGVIGVAWRSGKFLAIKRSQFVRSPNCWCFPGGGIEKGESEREALLREMREELGVECRIIGKLWHSEIFSHVSLAWWQIELPETTLQLQVEEVAEAVWLTPAELWAKDKLLESNQNFLTAWTNGEFRIADLN